MCPFRLNLFRVASPFSVILLTRIPAVCALHETYGRLWWDFKAVGARERGEESEYSWAGGGRGFAMWSYYATRRVSLTIMCLPPY